MWSAHFFACSFRGFYAQQRSSGCRPSLRFQHFHDLRLVSALEAWPIYTVVLFSWAIALFEYSFMVPANRIGFEGNGGPFSLVQLKIIQECITLTVFALFSVVVFQNHFGWNHLAAFVCLVMAVFFVFYK